MIFHIVTSVHSIEKLLKLVKLTPLNEHYKTALDLRGFMLRDPLLKEETKGETNYSSVLINIEYCFKIYIKFIRNRFSEVV